MIMEERERRRKEGRREWKGEQRSDRRGTIEPKSESLKSGMMMRMTRGKRKWEKRHEREEREHT